MKTNAKCLLLAGCHDRHRPKAHKSRTHKSTAAATERNRRCERVATTSGSSPKKGKIDGFRGTVDL